MTIATNSKVLINDLNSAITTFNTIWSTGSGSSGYGQDAVSFPSAGKIKASDWSTLVDNLRKALQHQNTSFTAMTTPTAGTKINALSLSSNLTAANNNSLNARFPVDISTYVSQPTSQTSFNNNQTITVTAIFGSHDKARYFFNAGGQFNLTCSHPNGSVGTAAAYLGTIRFGAGVQTIGGENYTGVTYLGTLPGNQTIFTSKGFYNTGSGAPSINTTIAYAYAGTVNAGVELYASYNGAGRLTFTMKSFAWAGVQPASIPTISAGSYLRVAARMPLTTYLADSWGPISFSSTVDEVSTATEASELTIMAHWYNNRSKYVRTGLSRTSYPNLQGGIYGEYYQWNSPHFRFNNGYYTELFEYDTASSPKDLSEYFTVVTCVTGALGGGRIDTPTDLPFNSVDIGTWGQLVSTKYKIYTGDFVDRTQPNNQYNDGIAYRISVYRGDLADNNQNYVSAPQSGQNAGSWTYQFIIPGSWSDAKEEVDFDVNANRTLGPGRMAVILSERGGNFGSLQQAATPYAINYDTWWYNGGDFQINPNPTSSPINVDLRYWNSGYTPRVYLELSKDGGAATPTTTAPAPAPSPPPFDPGDNPGYFEQF